MDPQNCPTIVKTNQHVDKFLNIFLLVLGPILGPCWGPDWAQDRPKRRQDPRRTSRASKYRTTTSAKNVIFPMQKAYFSSLGGFQDDHKSFRKAPKRHLKSSNTPKKASKIGPENYDFLVNVGADVGLRWTLKLDQQ